MGAIKTIVASIDESRISVLNNHNSDVRLIVVEILNDEKFVTWTRNSKGFRSVFQYL